MPICIGCEPYAPQFNNNESGHLARSPSENCASTIQKSSENDCKQQNISSTIFARLANINSLSFSKLVQSLNLLSATMLYQASKLNIDRFNNLREYTSDFTCGENYDEDEEQNFTVAAPAGVYQEKLFKSSSYCGCWVQKSGLLLLKGQFLKQEYVRKKAICSACF